MDITNDIRYVGVNDHEVDLFEGQYTVESQPVYYKDKRHTGVRGRNSF